MADQHITPHPNGGWQVKAQGAKRATVITDTQAQAWIKGKEIAKNQNAELYLHNKEGQIRMKNSYGNDPFPPQG